MNEASKPDDKIKYGESRRVTIRELESRPGLPSQIFRELEASLIGNLARSVALSGRRFDGWPVVTVKSSPVDWFSAYLELHAEVTTR